MWASLDSVGKLRLSELLPSARDVTKDELAPSCCVPIVGTRLDDDTPSSDSSNTFFR